jgi:signal transduction histidine kinase
MLDFLAPALDSARVSATAGRTGEGPSSVVALADPDLVEQILLNLLKNAIEAVGPGGRIRVEASTENGRAILEVADNGPGLGPDARAHLFQPFVTSKGQGGTGLGLAVSRRLARTLGGELVYVPTAHGTRWRLTLPLLEAA